jgi:membrane-bound inhibitor of C-type lysozyme
MNTFTKFVVLTAVIILAVLALVFYRVPSNQHATTVNYACNADKTITAVYYQGETTPAASSDQPPIPGGSVSLTLSDGRALTLAQTISADGVRYANADESFVFWSKGNGALVLENNVEKSYIGCIMVASEPASYALPQVYSNSGDGFSLRLPAGYTIDESYRYQELGPGKSSAGVKFTIPASVAAGTNLGEDTYISVEEAPQVQNCSAAFFVDPETPIRTIVEGDTTYSIASSTSAGAGNRYEETVYALPGTNPCVAVRYFIHYGVFENYPSGTIQEFNQQTLRAQFDAIRHTLILNQGSYNADYKNISYTIGGKSVKLVNGYAETPAASGSASKIITHYFGNDALGDLNGDGRPDVGFILTQNSGGSGTFYYAVAALQTADGYQGTNAVLLGDRIAPQTDEIRNGQFIVNYADRAVGEPMTAQPSVGVSKYLVVHGTVLKESQPIAN